MVVGNFTLPSEVIRNCTDGFLICFAQWTLLVTQGTFFIFALLAFCVILIMATSSLGMIRAFGFGSFVGMIGSIWLGIMGLINWSIASVFILTGLIGVSMLIISER